MQLVTQRAERVRSAMEAMLLMEGRMRGQDDLLLKLYYQVEVLRDRQARMNAWLNLKHDGDCPFPLASRRAAARILEGRET